jgi:hypothetical protein
MKVVRRSFQSSEFVGSFGGFASAGLSNESYYWSIVWFRVSWRVLFEYCFEFCLECVLLLSVEQDSSHPFYMALLD